MENVLEDLVSQGVLTQPTTAEMLKVKLKGLMRAYKCAKDAEKRTGAGSIHVPFMAQMEEIFGDRPIASANHCLSLSGQTIATLPVDKEKAPSPPPAHAKSQQKRKVEVYEEYCKEKIKMKKICEENKMKRHNERLQLEREKLHALKSCLKEK